MTVFVGKKSQVRAQRSPGSICTPGTDVLPRSLCESGPALGGEGRRHHREAELNGRVFFLAQVVRIAGERLPAYSSTYVDIMKIPETATSVRKLVSADGLGSPMFSRFLCRSRPVLVRSYTWLGRRRICPLLPFGRDPTWRHERQFATHPG